MLNANQRVRRAFDSHEYVDYVQNPRLRRASNKKWRSPPLSCLFRFRLAPQALRRRSLVCRSECTAPSPVQPLTYIRICGGYGISCRTWPRRRRMHAVVTCTSRRSSLCCTSTIQALKGRSLRTPRKGPTSTPTAVADSSPSIYRLPGLADL